MRFDQLGLSADILRAVSKQGYTEPTPVQREAIPAVLDGNDLMAGAQTGTGKTAAFVLPLLQRLSEDDPRRSQRKVRSLILAPTRELARQVQENVRDYSRYLALKSTVIHGGVSIKPQINTLRNGVDILVATPGRLLDHVGQRTLDLSKVEILVLDEADRMLDMGFIRDIRKILKLLPKTRQNLLFSATSSDAIRELANELMDSPKSIEVARRSSPAELVNQMIHPVDQSNKRALLSYLIGSKNWRQVLVFTRTKHGADRLTRQLAQDGLKAIAIHGNKSQGARTRALADFKQGRTRVLVATDIAARGLDIDQLPHVVNYELPNVPEDYVHRIGRTGRAGNEGEAMSLVSRDERKHLRGIERLLKRSLPSEIVPGYEPDPNAAPAPTEKPKKTSGRRRHSGNRKPSKNSGGPRHGKRRQSRQRGKAASG